MTDTAYPLSMTEQYIVTGWWLAHTDRFNEIANEEDYDDSDNHDSVR